MTTPVPTTPAPRLSLLPLLLVLLPAALLVRLVTYNGLFGSDDLTYFERALDVAAGSWSNAHYNGALRYGFNLPAGLLAALFGARPAVVNLWPLACSLVEVGLVAVFAAHTFGRRAAWLAGVLLLTTPLHVAVATRIHADSVVSMFISASFVAVWFGIVRGSARLMFVAGLLIGAIFWAKELVAITWLALMPVAWCFRRRLPPVWPVVAGVSLMLLLHGALMTAMAGDPLHLVRTVLGQVRRNFIGASQGVDDPLYYLPYLFTDLRHVGLLGWLALLSLRPRGPAAAAAAAATPPGALVFVWLWFAGLLLVLSLLPVSLSPLRLVMKQSNYLTLFLAPLCILAAVGLAGLPRRAALALATLAAALGLALAALQQADHRVFTANTRALAAWAAAHPGSFLIGSTNNAGLGTLLMKLQHLGDAPPLPILSFRDVVEQPERFRQAQQRSEALFGVLDPQTARWFGGATPVLSPLGCWETPGEAVAPAGLAWSNRAAGAISRVLARPPLSGLPLAAATARTLQQLAAPATAHIHRIAGADPLCRPGGGR